MAHEYIAVVGGVNIDIGGQSSAKLIPRDSNPGVLSMGIGGVGRNIAQNLALLGADVRFLTAFGDDDHAALIEAGCALSGIDITHALKVPGGATSTYLYINDSDGDMALAVNDMAICEKISPEYLSANRGLLRGASAVLVDTNVPEETIRYLGRLCEECGVPLFADPVSVSKAVKLKGSLSGLHTLKANRIEAELLSGVSVTDDQSLTRAAEALLKAGVKRVFITLGQGGVLAADGNESLRVPSMHADVKSTTGAGDAFTAALVYCYLKGMTLRETSVFATAAASVAVESERAVNPDMSPKAVMRKVSER